MKTRTLLVPLEEWSGSIEPASIIASIEEPEPESITGPLGQVLIEPSSTTPRNILVGPSHVDFVHRYFAEGICPVVWVADPHPDRSLERLLRFAWPALRRRIAACTCCLQPRSLDQRPFDVMFAPTSSLHRFASISQEHILRPDGGRSPVPNAPWESRLAHQVFGGSQTEQDPWNTQLLAELPCEPTSVRLVYQLFDLLARVPASPTAAVAALDVLGVLAPAAPVLADTKHRVLRTALDAARRLSDPSEALHVLQLINARIARPAFADVAVSAAEELTGLVATRAESDLRTATDMVTDVLNQEDEQDDSSAFVTGVTQAVVRSAQKHPSSLKTLAAKPRIVKRLFDQNPGLVDRFFDSFVQSAPSDAGLELLMSWIAALPPKRQDATRKELLARIRPECPPSVPLVLIADIDEATVSEAVNALLSANAPQRGPAVYRAMESLAARFPGPTRQAMPLHEQHQAEWAPILASTYTSSLAGLRELLEDDVRDGPAQAEVLAQFLNSAYLHGAARWLRQLNGCAGSVLSTLLRGDAHSPAVKSALDAVINYSEDLHGTVRTVNPQAVGCFVGSEGGHRLVHALMRDAVRTFLRGELDVPSYRSWLEPNWAQEWYAQQWPSDLVNLAWETTHDAQRLWPWILVLPDVSYSRHAGMIRDLAARSLRSARSRRSPPTDVMVEVLRRSRALSPPHDHLQLCAEMLEFCFDATSSPVGQLVTEAFPDVYASLIRQSNATPSFWSLVTWWDWDKGKELRVLVVDRFLRSSWDPADLALLAVDSGLLPKLFKRIRREPRGVQYLERMARSLANRTDLRATRAGKELEALLANPDFSEEWD